MKRKPLFTIACLLLLGGLLPAAGFAAAPQPTSDLLLPYFEVDTAGPGITTLLGVGNALDRPVDVSITLHTNWGLPVWETTLRFQADEVKTFNLRDWLLGDFPGADPGAAELAHIQAALAGQASPADGLYYGSSVANDRAVGYVVLRTQGDRPDALWGDFFAVDVPQDFAQGDNLVDIDPAKECGSGLCRRHALRFLSGGAFDGGTQLVVWTPRQIQPSPAEPLLAADQLAVEASVYDEPGRRVEERVLLALPVAKIAVADLGLAPSFGWLDLVTETESYIGVDYSAENRYALSLRATCLPIVVPEGPRIRIKKYTNGDDADTAPGPSIAVGGVVTWEYEVTNTGGVALAEVTVTDDKGVAVSCPETALAPGESMTCVGHGVAAACQYRNVGTAVGRTAEGEEVGDYDPSHYVGTQQASIAIVKSTNGQDANDAQGPKIEVGRPVAWTYVVTNNGAVRLTDVWVSDDDPGVAVSCPQAELQPGESMTCTASGVAKLGQYRNVGTARGKPPCGPAVADDDPSHYFGEGPPDPGIKIEKLTNGQDADSAPGPTIPVGAPVTWQYVVTNTGGVTASNLSVTDDQGVAVSCPKTTLQPGESMTCTGHGVAQSCQYRNLGTVTGKTPTGTNLTASDPSHYFGQHHAAIRIVKSTNGQDANSAPGPTIAVGAPVLWSYVVANTGDVALTGVVVSDDQGVAVSCPKTTLQPGESMTCTGNGVAVAGQYRNVGTARGTPPCGAAVADDDPSHYYAPPPPLPGGEGCTPGYWKNHEDSWPPTGYSTGQTVQSVFGQASNYPTLGSATLHQALSFQGGSTLEGAAGNLLRAAVAALLDSAHPGVDYPRTTASVIGDVNAALASHDRDTMLGLASALDRDNNLGCPLN